MTLTRPVGMKRLAFYLQAAYVFVALSGSLWMQASASLITVHAQVADESSMERRWESKAAQIDHHFEATDARVQELSDRIATIQGMGAGAFGVLTVLQVLGIIATSKAQK
jgi:hypothetical protein